jgi:hypothetical protein
VGSLLFFAIIFLNTRKGFYLCLFGKIVNGYVINSADGRCAWKGGFSLQYCWSYLKIILTIGLPFVIL